MKIQVGYSYGSPTSYEVYDSDGNYVAKNDANCREFASELERRYNAFPAMLEALRALYEETAEYIRINSLGDVHHNRSMQMARDAIKLATGDGE